jgi:hypothetical protein
VVLGKGNDVRAGDRDDDGEGIKLLRGTNKSPHPQATLATAASPAMTQTTFLCCCCCMTMVCPGGGARQGGGRYDDWCDIIDGVIGGIGPR